MIPQPQDFRLDRFPRSSDKSLRAWNAADEYLLSELEQRQLAPSCRILVINDQFGALSLCLAQFQPAYWSDSYLSLKAIDENLKRNLAKAPGAQPWQLQVNPDLSITLASQASQDENFDLVILRVPKHNSLLKFQLEAIKPWLNPGAAIIAGGMTKEIHNSTLQIFEQAMGPTKTSLARKKARLIYSQFDNPQQAEVELASFQLQPADIEVCGLAGVFSKDSLDIGARVMLNHMPELSPGDKVIDLGCGNGVLAASLAVGQPKAHFVLTDESALAVNSANLTFLRNGLINGEFHHTNILEGVSVSQVDQVVCNPPFHQQNVQTLSIAQGMFRAAAKSLKTTGELRVVANRHLPYAKSLSRYFERVRSIAADNKFSVWLAQSPRQ